MAYSISELRKNLQPIFLEHNVKKAILFGSYSKGEETDYSDVDILVDSGLKGLSFYGLLYDISDKLKKDVDLFDYRQFSSSSPIFKDIQENGVVIYER